MLVRDALERGPNAVIPVVCAAVPGLRRPDPRKGVDGDETHVAAFSAVVRHQLEQAARVGESRDEVERLGDVLPAEQMMRTRLQTPLRVFECEVQSAPRGDGDRAERGTAVGDGETDVEREPGLPALGCAGQDDEPLGHDSGHGVAQGSRRQPSELRPAPDAVEDVARRRLRGHAASRAALRSTLSTVSDMSPRS